MITDHQCPVCQEAQLATGGGPVTPETGEMHIRLTTDPVVVATCFHGHKSVLAILDGAYALLFERALQRLVTGNTRDAVVDAYTAFEMYLAQVPARARYDREAEASAQRIRRELDGVSRYAERALGAALAVISLIDGQPPPKVDPRKTTELRNRSVHAGYYPTDAEAEALCVEISRIISEFDRRFEAQGCVNPTTYWQSTIDDEIRQSRERHGIEALPTVVAHFGTELASNRAPNRSTFSLEERISEYRSDVLEDETAWRVW